MTKRAVVAGGEVGQVAVLVEDLGHDADLLREGEARGALPRALQAALGAAVEDAFQQLGILVLDVLQQLVGQLGVGAGKEGVAGRGEGEDVLGPAGAAARRSGARAARRAPARSGAGGRR